MKRWMLLGANNDDTTIDVESYPAYEEAYAAMKAEFEEALESMPDGEHDITDDGASVFEGHDGGSLYYWNIREVEV